ncbi:MAG: DNA replication/repair protein RecF [Lachnospiraceae bacterium]|nr:DNA replication/repair protein RecF [Lachnospiraceae bacterium]
MIIKKLQLSNFRNYEGLTIEFSEGVNLLYGDNAKGKTNILEAVFMIATTKSIRGSKDKDMIRFGQEEAHICAFVEKGGIPHKMDIHLRKNKKKGLAVDGIPVKRSAEFLGLLHGIAFSPDDLSMMKEGPELRRRFMDLELCQTDPLYVSNLAGYNRVVAERNDLLKQIAVKPSLQDTLPVWDAQLLEFGTYLIRARRKFLERLAPIVEEKHRMLSGDKETLKIAYEPDCTEDSFGIKLAEATDRDLALRFTSVGPHRDDMSLFINGNNVRLYGSQGQQRTAALSLKFAEIELVKNVIRESPILLLDDVLSELDRSRQLQLLSEMQDVQTIVTCTGMEEFVQCRPEGNTIFAVDGNGVTKV